MKATHRITIPLAAIALMALAGAAAAFFCLKSLTSERDPNGGVSARIEIQSGDSAKKIAAALEKEKIIKNKDAFYILARFPKLASLLFNEDSEIFCVKTGVCRVNSGMNAAAIYKELSAGHEELTYVSVPEGLTISKVAARMESAGVCSAKDFIEAAKGQEGFLFPDTYALAPNSDAAKVVKIMRDNFFQKISEIPSLKDASQKELSRLVTLASIIEREYRSPDEAPLIASVFTNRIKKGIGLYSCATVEYVITEVLGRPHPDIITYDDLKIQSPYNTYINAGLPPSPICNPGLVALKAAAEPAQTDYYYFQLMDEREGRHVFTKTLSEHVAQGAIFKTKKASR